MKTRNHLRRTLLLPTLLLALLPPCACTDDICPDTAPLPGDGSFNKITKPTRAKP